MNKLILWAVIIFLFPELSCGPDQAVSLRKFPYPYKAALAISSDIDQTGSYEEFATIQQFFNTEDETIFGRGLGLEIGNSYWFYNDSYLANDSNQVDKGISLYYGISDSLNDYSGRLKDLIRAGYIDCFHSFGHFGTIGLNRELAERAIDDIYADSLATDVYINHGAVGTNFQNIGGASYCLGDNPESEFYHTDISIPTGIKFLWRGQLTHCIGQDADFAYDNMFKQWIEYFQSLGYSEQDFTHDNKLVHPYTLDDGTPIFEFVRYVNPRGYYPEAIINSMPYQLGFEQVDELIDNAGYMIFYTHFGRNDGYPYLDDSTVTVSRYIKAKNKHGQLMVTTTSKLLNYYIHHKYLHWHYNDTADSTFIYIDSISNEVEGSYIPDYDDLEGLTFYVPDGKTVQIYSGEKLLDIRYNKSDATGRHSVSIPWQKLTLPDDFYNYPDGNRMVR